MKVPVTFGDDDVGNEDQDLDKDHPSTQLFVPLKTAPKGENERATTQKS